MAVLEAESIATRENDECPVCRGKGWLCHDVPYGDPLFSKYERCPRCAGQDQPAARTDTCGLPPRLRGVTFDTIKHHPGNAAAYDAALDRAQRPRHFLTFIGPPGVGKSTLLGAIVNAGRAAGLSARYTTLADLLDRYRATIKPNAEADYEALQEQIKDVRLLCIDEFDRFKASEWAQEKLFQLVNVRWDYGEDRLTCFASNSGLAAFPEYIQSRMGDRYSGVYELTGGDIRKRLR